MTGDGNGSEPEVSGRSPMSGTRQLDDLAGLAEKQQLAGRHHAALDSLRPYFVARDLDPVGASCFVRLSLDVSRVVCEMGLAETAAGLWSVILPGLAGGKSIDRARWVLLAAEACAASHEGGGTVSRLGDTVERDALDTPAGSAQRFLRADPRHVHLVDLDLHVRERFLDEYDFTERTGLLLLTSGVT